MTSTVSTVHPFWGAIFEDFEAITSGYNRMAPWDRTGAKELVGLGVGPLYFEAAGWATGPAWDLMGRHEP